MSEKFQVSGLLGDPRPIIAVFGMRGGLIACAKDARDGKPGEYEPDEFDIIKPYPEPAGNGPVIWLMCIRGRKVIERINTSMVGRLTHDSTAEAEEAAHAEAGRRAAERFAEKGEDGMYSIDLKTLRDIAENAAQIDSVREAALAELKARGAIVDLPKGGE